MADIIKLELIKKILNEIDPIQMIEDGFVAYSLGKVVVPPVGEMIFQNPPGDCHIKYGYIKNGDYYIVKIASGFYENPKIGLPSNTGLNLVFNQKTGQLECILLDEGYLTNIRTAAAGAVAAKYFAPKQVNRIGIYGSGDQGRLQLRFLKNVLKCRDALVWGISQDELDRYRNDMKDSGFNIETTLDSADIPQSCNFIVTCTPSKKPLILANQVRPGTHITAMGSDTPEKQELDPEILARADKIIVDSKFQVETRGECFKAMQAGAISKEKLIELGETIQNPSYQRENDEEITVVDLTGVAIQDIQISKAILKGLHQ
ncbi:MAG: ornithine cyclodeaminase family protein [Promethearchaeota archaeon]